MRLTLPLPPSGNHYRGLAKGRFFVRDEAVDFKRTVKLRGLAAGLRPGDGPVYVSMHVYRRQRRGDADGFSKVLLDSLQGVAYRNDSQVRRLVIELHEDPDDPRVEVDIEPYRRAP